VSAHTVFGLFIALTGGIESSLEADLGRGRGRSDLVENTPDAVITSEVSAPPDPTSRVDVTLEGVEFR